MAEGGLEMLVAGKRLEEVRPHLFMPHHQFVPILPLLPPYLLLFSPSSPPPLPFFVLPLPPLSIFFPSSLPPLSFLSLLFPLLSLIFLSSPSSFHLLSLLSLSLLSFLSLLFPSSFSFSSSSPSSLPPLSLLSLLFPSKACQTEEGLSNVAAAAEQFQPKGITLATTEVRTSMYCHSCDKFFWALSHFSVLQTIESWVGPGNEAVVNISFYYAYKHEHA